MWLYKFFTGSEHSALFAPTSDPKDVEHTPSAAAERIAQGCAIVVKRDKQSMLNLLEAVNEKLAPLMQTYETCDMPAKAMACMYSEICYLVDARGRIECELFSIKSCEARFERQEARDAAEASAKALQAKAAQDEDEEDVPEQPQAISDASEPQVIADTPISDAPQPIPGEAKPQPDISEPHEREQIALF